MDLSIVTISTNEGHFVGPCLQSLWATAGSMSLEVFVVDNCSTDGSAEIARASFPGVHIIHNQTRRGFSANNNAAIRLSRGRYILVINPDTVFHPGALETLVAYMDAHPEVGICGPQLRFPDGRIQPSCRRFPTWRSVLARRTPLRRFLWNSSLNANHLMLHADYTQIQPVDWMLGACLMARRAAVEQVGLLDEGFILYVEDIDWCYRMHQSGWKVMYVPTAQVTHYHQAETDRRWFTRRTWTHYHSMTRFVWKHHLRPKLTLSPPVHKLRGGTLSQPESRR